jgi:hypothetical protein
LEGLTVAAEKMEQPDYFCLRGKRGGALHQSSAIKIPFAFFAAQQRYVALALLQMLTKLSE